MSEHPDDPGERIERDADNLEHDLDRLEDHLDDARSGLKDRQEEAEGPGAADDAES